MDNSKIIFEANDSFVSQSPISLKIDVKMNLIYITRKFLEDNWKWIITMIITSGAIGWLSKKRRGKESKREPLPRREPIYTPGIERTQVVGEISYEIPIAERESISISRCKECPHYQPRNEKYGFCTSLKGSITGNHVACSWIREG